MDKPFFTVVMPAYQAEKYIKNAIDCIRKQKFKNFELLIIEDHSSDNTLQIAKEYEALDGRIRVIPRKENAGVSEARNLGIEKAQGEYLWFMDADDGVEDDLLEQVYLSLKKNPAKITVFGLWEEYYSADGELRYKRKRIPETLALRGKEDVRMQILPLEQQTLYGYPWNKVYDLEYLRGLGLKFEDYKKAKFIEDILFNISFCMDIDSMNLLGIAPYHYAKRANESLTNEFVPEYYRLHRRRIQSLWDQQKYWKLDLEKARNVLGSLYGRYILSALERNHSKKAHMSRKEKKEFCQEIFLDDLFDELVMQGQASESKMLKIALKLLKTKNISLNLWIAYCIHIAKAKLPIFYSKVKSGR